MYIAGGGRTRFPAAGVDYQLIIWDNVEFFSGDDDSNLSAPIFKFGLGLDISKNESVFYRPELLYGIRLTSKLENDYIDKSTAVPSATLNVSESSTRLGHGLTVKFSIGYKF